MLSHSLLCKLLLGFKSNSNNNNHESSIADHERITITIHYVVKFETVFSLLFVHYVMELNISVGNMMADGLV